MNARGIPTAAYQVLLGGVPPSPIRVPPRPGPTGDTRGGVPPWPGLTGGVPKVGYPPDQVQRGVPEVGYPPWVGVPPLRPGWGTPHLDLARVQPPCLLDLAWVPPPPPPPGPGSSTPPPGPGSGTPPPGWTWLGYPPPPGVDRQKDRHVSKHSLPAVLRTRSVNIFNCVLILK